MSAALRNLPYLEEPAGQPGIPAGEAPGPDEHGHGRVGDGTDDLTDHQPDERMTTDDHPDGDRCADHRRNRVGDSAPGEAQRSGQPADRDLSGRVERYAEGKAPEHEGRGRAMEEVRDHRGEEPGSCGQEQSARQDYRQRGSRCFLDPVLEVRQRVADT